MGNCEEHVRQTLLSARRMPIESDISALTDDKCKQFVSSLSYQQNREKERKNTEIDIVKLLAYDKSR